ncbi:hypothetical protein HY498_01025 [Candidatus Woesearchaeota archaeon]|nr:hypothetical protein [Candidatus Woesearchaeota archaeon]
MKINCPHCTKEIEFILKANLPSIEVPINGSSNNQVTPIISRGVPIQSHGTVYVRDNDTGQVFTQPKTNGDGINGEAKQNIIGVERPQVQTTLTSSQKNVAIESAKNNVVNDPSIMDSERVRSAAFGTTVPSKGGTESKHKEAENLLTKLASSG